MHRGVFCQFLLWWIYYCHSSKSTEKKTSKTHLCAVYYSILNYFGQRSQCISIHFPLHKQSENLWICYLLTKTVYCFRLYGNYGIDNPVPFVIVLKVRWTDWCAVESPKKRTNKFVFFCFLTLHSKKNPIRSFLFLGESTTRKSA